MSTTVFPRPSVSERRSRSSPRLRSLILGQVDDPAWARPALIALLVATALAYSWNLTASGYANSFYAAAVQAATKSWKAFFFGSIDSSNFITVDKPPASLWVMALSGRVFGFSSASMLVPQVLEGVVSVALLSAAVKRWFGAGAGLLAGALLAVTPVAALMFRFNNPDALLVCLLVASAYCLVRALERGGTGWVLATGALIGFAFLAKMMQAFLVVPGFALVYLVAAPVGLRRRAAQLLAGGGAIAVSAGWWVAIVALWPAGSRPMIDGSPDNSILNLIVGYNGLGRIFGSSGPGGGVGGGFGRGGGGGGFSGPAGALRLFDALMGGQASWLLPAALLVVVAGLWSTRRAPRTDRTRAALLLWGSWLVVSGAVFSLSTGVIHTYYTVALAPAIAAVVAIGARELWRRRSCLLARGLMAAGVVVTATWAVVLLDRTPGWLPWLRAVIAGAAVLAGAALLVFADGRVARRRAAVTAVLAAIACLAGPVAYSAATVDSAHTGSVPSAGPATGSGVAGTVGGGGALRAGGPRVAARGGDGPGIGTRDGGGPGGGARDSGGPFGTGAPPTAGASRADFPPPGAFAARAGGAPAGAGGSRAGGAGAISVSGVLERALKSDAFRYRWVAATSGSQSAATLELATGGEPVMAIGGFNGQGGNLTLGQFERYVHAGEIHYYIGGGVDGGGGPGGPGGGNDAIASWVAAHYRSETIGGETVYDLTRVS